jgi:thiol-disulfide isomerase/thioredoxin
MSRYKGKVSAIFILFFMAVNLVWAQSIQPLDQGHLTTLNGRPATLAALHGKVLLVNFWATWCAPCRREMPLLQRQAAQWQRHGIEIIGIALDNRAAVQEFVQRQAIRYPIWLADDQVTSLMPALGNPASVLPFSMLLDRQGQQIARWTGIVSEQQLKQALAPYLRQLQ